MALHTSGRPVWRSARILIEGAPKPLTCLLLNCSDNAAVIALGGLKVPDRFLVHDRKLEAIYVARVSKRTNSTVMVNFDTVLPAADKSAIARACRDISAMSA